MKSANKTKEEMVTRIVKKRIDEAMIIGTKIVDEGFKQGIKRAEQMVDEKLKELDTCFKKVTKAGDKHAQDIYFTSINDLEHLKQKLTALNGESN